MQNAYTLAFGGLLLFGARAGDIVGRRRMFTIGIAIFTAASLAVGVAQSPGWLIAARAVQGLGAGLLIGLVVNEGRVRQPIMPLRLFGDRERVGAYAGRILYLGAMLGFWFFITQFLQEVYHYTPLQAGVAFLPLSVVNFAVPLTVPHLTRRRGNARVLAVGVTVTFLGMAWLSRLSADTPYVTGLALPMVLLGTGQGASLGPLTAAGTARVTPDDAGAPSGLVNVAHQLGGSLGLGILVTVFAASSPTLTGNALLAHQVSAALTVGAGLLALALIVVLALIVTPHHRTVMHGR